MTITVNTDASFSENRKIGSYAYQIIGFNFTEKKSGPIPSRCWDSTEAEAKCIFNAIYFIANNTFLMQEVKRIIVNTDSLNAIHLFRNDYENIGKFNLNKPHLTYQKRRMNQWLKTRLAGKIVEFRHVKSHTGEQNSRSVANGWCDNAAKIELGIMLNK